MRTSFLIAALACATMGMAQVVPNGFDNTPANATFALTSTVTTRTYQMQINANQLTSVVGMNLAGLQFRLNETATSDWPATNVDFTQFDIYIGQGVDPSVRSTTFADNFVGSPTQVRSGALTIGAGSYSSTGSPVKPFGPAISFSDYLYTGGHLTIEMRYSTQSTGTQPSFDAANSSTAGYGTDFGASWAADSTATTATNSFTANFLVTKLVARPVPEPATLVVLGLGTLAAIRRRRRG